MALSELSCRCCLHSGSRLSLQRRYARLRNAREAKAYRYQQGVISGKHTLIQVKEAPPYTEEQQPQVYLDPTARASYDPVVGSWTFGGAHPARTSAAKTSSPQSSPKPIATRDRVDSSTRLAATMERGAAVRAPLTGPSTSCRPF